MLHLLTSVVQILVLVSGVIKQIVGQAAVEEGPSPCQASDHLAGRRYMVITCLPIALHFSGS